MSVLAPTPGSALTAAAQAQAPAAATDSGAAYKEMLGVVVAIVMLWLINKTSAGHTMVYYALLLLIVLMLVTQYPFVVSALSPLSHAGAPTAPPGSPGGSGANVRP